MRFVKCFVTFVVVLVIFSVSVAQDDKPGTSETPQTKPNNEKSEEYLKELEHLKTDFTAKCNKSIEDGNSMNLLLIIEEYNEKTKKYKQLKPLIKKYFNKYAKIRTAEITCIDDNNRKIKELLKLGKSYRYIVNNKKKMEKIFLQAIELSDDDELNSVLYEEIGYAIYNIPNSEDWDEILTLHVCEDKLSGLLSKDGSFVSPNECKRLEQVEKEIFEEYSKLKEEFKKDPFKREIYKTKAKLRIIPYLKKEDLEVVDAKPYAIYIQKDDEYDSEFIEKVKEQKPILEQYWKQIKKNWIERLKLKSHIKGDTTETPKPFVLICLKDRKEFDDYLEMVDKKVPSFARAYYSMVSQFVTFYRDTENKNPINICNIVHEITEQILDRYSIAKYGLRDVKSHFIIKGFAEYMTGHEIVEKTKEYKFASIKFKARMQMFGLMKKVYGNHDSYVYDNFKDDNKALFLPPKEDWNVTPIESLITGRTAGFVIYYGGILTQMYTQTFKKAYNKSNPKDRKLVNRGMFLQSFGKTEFIHGQFYVTSWAFTHFLIEKYPKEYDEIFKEALSGKPFPQAFSKAFELDLDLPDIEKLIDNDCYDDEKKLTEKFCEQIKKIQSCEKVQNIERAFHTWLEKKYKEVIGKPIYEEKKEESSDDEEKDSDDDDDDDGFDDWE